MRQVILALAADFEKESGHKLAIPFDSGTIIARRLAAGVHIAGMLERLGIGGAVAPKLVLSGHPDREDEMSGRRVAAGQAEIALHPIQKLMAVPGIEVVGPLPKDLDAPFVFSAALQMNSVLSRFDLATLPQLLQQVVRGEIHCDVAECPGILPKDLS